MEARTSTRRPPRVTQYEFVSLLLCELCLEGHASISLRPSVVHASFKRAYDQLVAEGADPRFRVRPNYQGTSRSVLEMLEHCYRGGSIVVFGSSGLLRIDERYAQRDLGNSALPRESWQRIAAAFLDRQPAAA